MIAEEKTIEVIEHGYTRAQERSLPVAQSNASALVSAIAQAGRAVRSVPGRGIREGEEEMTLIEELRRLNADKPAAPEHFNITHSWVGAGAFIPHNIGAGGSGGSDELSKLLPAIITLLEAGQALADDLLWAAHQNDHGMVLTTAEVAEVRASLTLWNAAKAPC